MMTKICLKSLKRHKETHEIKENEYTCELCDRTFEVQGSLHTHIRNAHDFEGKSCDNCDKSYTNL